MAAELWSDVLSSHGNVTTKSSSYWDMYAAPGVVLTFKPTPAPTASPTPFECRRRLLGRRRRLTATSIGRGGGGAAEKIGVLKFEPLKRN